MILKNTAWMIILLFILGLLYTTSGECVIYPFEVHSNIQFEYTFHDKWCIYNLEDSLSEDDIYEMLKIYGEEPEFEFVVVCLPENEQLNYIEYIPFTVKTQLQSDAREYYPFGKSNNTIVIFPIDELVVKNNIRGGALGARAFVVYDVHKDTTNDLKVRILHELAHCYSLDADGLFSTQQCAFYGWMLDKNYVFSDFYYNNQNYYTIAKHPKTPSGHMVFIDYTRWLLSKIK